MRIWASLRHMLGHKLAPPIVALGPWALGVIIALTTPNDILSRSGMLQGYAEWFANIFPYMNRAATHSAFPEVTLFFHAAMWTIAPMWLGIWLLIKPDTRLYEKQRRHRWFLLFWIVTFLLVLIYVPFSLMFTSPELTRVEKAMSFSRLGLGISGTALYAGGCVFYLRSVIVWIQRIPALYFDQSSNGQKV